MMVDPHAHADPQVQARDMIVRLPHPLTDALELVASPMKLSATPVQVQRPPPLLGQHTDEVLATLGLDAAARAFLRQQGIIGAAPDVNETAGK